jgi:hypothetical protein
MASSPSRPMSKSPIALAKEALAAGASALSSYSHKFSRHDFIQAQLFAILVLRQFFRTDYRGIQQLLRDLPDLCRVLELKKVPHFTTLQKAEQRFLKKGALNLCCEALSSLPVDMA